MQSTLTVILDAIKGKERDYTTGGLNQASGSVIALLAFDGIEDHSECALHRIFCKFQVLSFKF